MGALFGSRKRGNGYYEHSPASVVTHFDHFRFPKKHRLSGSMDQRASDFCRPGTSNAVASRIIRYPDSKPEFRREVNAPVRNNRFGISYRVDKGEASAGSKESSADKMKILLGRYKSTQDLAMESLRYITKDEAAVSLRLEDEKEAIEIDGDEENQVVVSDDSNVEEVEILKKKLQSLNSSVVTDLSNEHAKVDVVEKMMNLMQLEHGPADIVVPAHIKLYDSSLTRNDKLQRLDVEIKLAEMQHRRQLLLRPLKDTREEMRDVAEECFVPLSAEEVAEVTSKLSSKSNRGKVLVSHEISNIDITWEKFQCLKPGGWLNDEVINLYVELLKEREKREPQKFLKCHFFNTFFYKKLIAGKGGYNFQSVRRWTTPKKLGYSLLDCNKIFVPIHKINHWCLAVINKKDEKFQYLDSLKGGDNKVMKVLARYYVDEVNDKSDKDIDVSSWAEEFVEDLPEQENGFDCGMFMLKYADFYSRDIRLCFSQVFELRQQKLGSPLNVLLEQLLLLTFKLGRQQLYVLLDVRYKLLLVKRRLFLKSERVNNVNYFNSLVINTFVLFTTFGRGVCTNVHVTCPLVTHFPSTSQRIHFSISLYGNESERSSSPFQAKNH